MPRNIPARIFLLFCKLLLSVCSISPISWQCAILLISQRPAPRDQSFRFLFCASTIGHQSLELILQLRPRQRVSWVPLGLVTDAFHNPSIGQLDIDPPQPPLGICLVHLRVQHHADAFPEPQHVRVLEGEILKIQERSTTSQRDQRKRRLHTKLGRVDRLWRRSRVHRSQDINRPLMHMRHDPRDFPQCISDPILLHRRQQRVCRRVGMPTAGVKLEARLQHGPPPPTARAPGLSLPLRLP